MAAVGAGQICKAEAAERTYESAHIIPTRVLRDRNRMMAYRRESILLVDQISYVRRRWPKCKKKWPTVYFNPTAFNKGLAVQ
eukprot:COSAG02_NODE_7006_length_3229_cov_41.784026_4_plen_82_part_00